MAELKVYNIADDEEIHNGCGTILCSINSHNMKIGYVYNILENQIIFNYGKEYEREACQAFEKELKEHVSCHWLSKLNTKKR